MRPVQERGLAPLIQKDVQDMHRQHIPYRAQLLKDGVRPLGAITQQNNQAFEAGVISGRLLLSFLGVGFDEKSEQLREDRRHKMSGEMTDDVKVRDVGGTFVELATLSTIEVETLCRFIHGAHKACAHFTIGSDHELNAATYEQAVPIILRLLRECLPNKIGQFE